jgi:sec-independent protein translocase protein TatA
VTAPAASGHAAHRDDVPSFATGKFDVDVVEKPMFRNLGAPEILLILAVLVLLFGAKKLPDLSRSVGKSMRIFKSEVKQMQDDDEPRPAPAPKPIEGTVQRADESPRQAVPEAERRDNP